MTTGRRCSSRAAGVCPATPQCRKEVWAGSQFEACPDCLPPFLGLPGEASEEFTAALSTMTQVRVLSYALWRQNYHQNAGELGLIMLALVGDLIAKPLIYIW